MAKDIRTKAHLQGGEIRTKANFGQTVTITVLPDPYEGQTTVIPSDERQTLPTRGKTVPVDIAVLPAPVESLATSENGTFLPSSGNVGFSEVVVDVEPSLESLSVTENGLYLPDVGVDGFDRVSVDVPAPEPVTEQLSVTENGIYEPESGVDGYSRVTVDVPPTIPDLVQLTATANGQYVPTGHDGYSQVNVNVEEQWDGSLVPDDSNPGYFHCRVINLLSTDTLVIDGKGTGYRWASTKSNMPQFEHFGQDFSTGKDVNAVYFHMRGYLVPLGDTTVVIGGPAWGADGAVYTGNYSFKGDYLRWKVIHAS